MGNGLVLVVRKMGLELITMQVMIVIRHAGVCMPISMKWLPSLLIRTVVDVYFIESGLKLILRLLIIIIGLKTVSRHVISCQTTNLLLFSESLSLESMDPLLFLLRTVLFTLLSIIRTREPLPPLPPTI